MENKQIVDVIDGVDVSECEHINTCDNKIKCVILQDDVCETNPYCEGYNCYYKQLKHKEQENEELRRSITKIFACLIKANRTNKIVDTLWVDDITTLWDYIALSLGIEGDQTQIEKQILQNQLI